MPAPLVALDDISVSFGAVAALRAITLEIGAGERVALIGPSGAGKSTLLGVLNGTVATTGGAARLDGEVIRDDERWRRRFGRTVATVPQQLHLSGPLRVVHNVNAGRLGSWSTGRALWSLVSPREISDARAVLGLVGIADKLYARTDQLSGGEQQRVAIARALRQQPTLMLADEPTASLDPTRAAVIMRLLGEVANQAGCALVVSQHDVTLALESCDRVIGLRDGAVRFDRAAGDVSDVDVRALYAIEAHR